jgi:multicomponent Na+:H+ antiporter subunit E
VSRQDSTRARASGRREAFRGLVHTVPLLAAFWLTLSGHFDLLLLTLGALSITVVCAMAWRADMFLHRDLTIRFALQMPRFFLWLGGQVFVSSLTVVRQVWSPRLVLRPVVRSTPAQELPELSQVTYANAITLTPGTLSLDVSDKLIRVHSLEPAGVDDLRKGAMLSRVPCPEARR